MIAKGETGLLSDNTVLFGWDEALVKLDNTVFKSQSGGKATVADIIVNAMRQAGATPQILTPSTHTRLTKSKPIPNIECHYKAKDGNLFFFKQGLVFGMVKKPLFFFPAGSFNLQISGVTVFETDKGTYI
jgi:Histone chaperone Rttp106-like